MPINTYECMTLLDSNKIAGDNEAAKDHLHTILDKHGCEIIYSNPWDEKRLAYPVNHHKKGLYYLIYLKADSQKIEGIEEDFRLSEIVLRHLIIKLHPKNVDELIKAAKEEKAGAIRIAGDDGLDTTITPRLRTPPPTGGKPEGEKAAPPAESKPEGEKVGAAAGESKPEESTTEESKE